MRRFLFVIRIIVIFIGFAIAVFLSSTCFKGTIFNKVENTTYFETEFFGFNPEIKIYTGGNRTYESTIDFPYNDMEFADSNAFEVIKRAYENINFYGEFERGNLNSYDSYKYKYKKMLENEVPFLVKDTGKELYLNEFGELKSCGNVEQYDINAFDFLYFDMDTDGYPELCLRGKSGFTYIFKYISKMDKYILWKELSVSYYQLNGSRKIRWEGAGSSSSAQIFHKLDESGCIEYIVYFFTKFCSSFNEMEDIYMLGLPSYANKDLNVDITKSLKEQSFFDKEKGIYYFRVTEEQYESLTKDYWEARELAIEKQQEVTYTYDELFGNSFR